MVKNAKSKKERKKEKTTTHSIDRIRIRASPTELILPRLRGYAYEMC